MSDELLAWALIALAAALANAPFVVPRTALLGPRKRKTLAQCLLECAALYALWTALGLWMEAAQGQIAPQKWEFYAITATVFLTLAFPGFVYRFLMHPKA